MRSKERAELGLRVAEREWRRQVQRWQQLEAAADAVHALVPKALAVLGETLEMGEPKERVMVALALLRWAELSPQPMPSLTLLHLRHDDLVAAELAAGNREADCDPHCRQ